MDAIQELKRFSTGSFAVWPFNHKAKGLHGRLVIMGLNPSAKVAFGQNFHAEGHQFDRWYQEGFSREPFRGAYMTDLISLHEPDSAIIIKKWRAEDGRFKRRNAASLAEQFAILDVGPETPILCIGKSTRKLFEEAFPTFSRVLHINHPNWYRMKDKKQVFLRHLAAIGKEVAKF